MTTPIPLEHIKRDLARAGLRSRSLLCQEDLDQLPAMKGAYALIVKLEHEVPLDRPRTAPGALSPGPLSPGPLSPGWYVYAGSARGPGGIPARLTRHFRVDKPVHWHIDQLTSLSGVKIWASPAAGQHECDLVTKLIRSGLFDIACPGFGSSDCRKCEGHLLVWRPERP